MKAFKQSERYKEGKFIVERAYVGSIISKRRMSGSHSPVNSTSKDDSKQSDQENNEDFRTQANTNGTGASAAQLQIEN